MASDATYDVFLSHATQDKPQVEELARRLRAEGLEPFLDKWHLVPGEPWQEAIEKAMGQSRACVVFVGPHLGPWQHEEMRNALDLRVRDDSRRVIPVLLPGALESELPPFLGRLTWVDFRSGLDDSYAWHRLLCGIRGKKPEDGPASPEPLPPPVRTTTIGKILLALRPTSFVEVETLSPRWWAQMAFLTAVLMAMAGTTQRPKPPHPRPSVAVITFENRSEDRNLDWLSTALAEAASAKLGLAGDVRAVDRLDVSQAEADLGLASQTKALSWSLANIRGLLGVDFILGGVYDRNGGTSSIRLILTLYDARNGRTVAQTKERKEEVSNWLVLAIRSTDDLPGLTLRQKLKWLPFTTSPKESLHTLFPRDFSAAKLYVQGLERYRRFDLREASNLFAESARIEPHPIVLAALANANASLGFSQEAWEAIKMAKRQEEQARGTPLALPGRYQLEFEITERKVAADQKGAAERTEFFFRKFFADDISYGLFAAQSLVDADSIDLAEPFLKELRLLPLAEDHPYLDRLEADALFVQQRYGAARIFARRAIVKAQTLRAVRQEALARLQLASIQSFVGEGAESERQLRLALAGFKKTEDRMGIAQCLENLALFYLNFDLLLAQDFYRQAISHYEALGNQRELGRALFGLSAVLTEASELTEAQEISRRASALASSPEVGLGPFILGYHAFLAGQLTRAQAQWETAKSIFDLNKQRDDYASTLTNLGEVELMRGKLAKAQDLHRKALTIHEEEQSEVIPYDRVCLGRVQAVAGRSAAARTWYEQALDTLEIEDGVPKEPIAWTEALLALAEWEFLSGDATEVEKRVRDLIDQAAAVGVTNSVRSRALSLLARYQLREGETLAAWETVSEAQNLARDDFRAVRESGIAAAQVRAARAEVNLALADLDRIAADTARSGQVIYELESILAAGEIEIRDGQLSRGRRRLEALRDRAEGLGLCQIVTRVDSALGKSLPLFPCYASFMAVPPQNIR